MNRARTLLAAAILLALHVSGFNGTGTSTAWAQNNAVARCIEIVPYYYPIDDADARLLCPGIVEALRGAQADEELNAKNYCALFMAMGLDDSDDTSKLACRGIFVAVLDSIPRTASSPPASAPVQVSVPAAVSSAPKPAAATSSGAPAWADEAVRDYQVSRRDRGISYSVSDLSRYYQCLTSQADSGREAALQACNNG